MTSFRKAYQTSAIIFSALAVSGVAVSFGSSHGESPELLMLLPLALLPWIPMLRKGGFPAHFRTARIVSNLMLLLAGCGLVMTGFDFLQTHGEGPHGEGSPAAGIVAMAFYGAVIFCPWLLTTLRGRSQWIADKKMLRPESRSNWNI